MRSIILYYLIKHSSFIRAGVKSLDVEFRNCVKRVLKYALEFEKYRTFKIRTRWGKSTHYGKIILLQSEMCVYIFL
jgi:hypothetical protein